jgi:hypothetical protein
MQARDDRTTFLWPTLIYALVLGVFSAGCRLLPYYAPALNDSLWNLAPMGALALFVGSRLRGHYAYAVPLAAMVVSDLLLIRPLAELGWPAMGWGRPLVYASFALYVLIGRLVRERERSPLKIGGAALLGSLQFFLITNFLVWWGGTTYPHTLSGLAECYALAVPFYRGTLTSDLLFTAAFFALHAGLLRVLAPEKARQPA